MSPSVPPTTVAGPLTGATSGPQAAGGPEDLYADELIGLALDLSAIYFQGADGDPGMAMTCGCLAMEAWQEALL